MAGRFQRRVLVQVETAQHARRSLLVCPPAFRRDEIIILVLLGQAMAVPAHPALLPRCHSHHQCIIGNVAGHHGSAGDENILMSCLQSTTASRQTSGCASRPTLLVPCLEPRAIFFLPSRENHLLAPGKARTGRDPYACRPMGVCHRCKYRHQRRCEVRSGAHSAGTPTGSCRAFPSC